MKITKKSIFGTLVGICLLSSSAIAQIVWFEDFTGLADGTTEETTGPSQWSIDVSGASFVNGNDYFEVRSEQMAARDVNGEVIWLSESIDISSSGDVFIQMDVTESGNMEFTDYVRAYYILNGVSGEVLFAEHTEDITESPLTLTSPLVNGSTLEIVVRIGNNGGQEIFNIDNIEVGQVETLISIGDAAWSDGTNWSSNGSLPSCGCTPGNTTAVTIQSGTTVDIDGAVNAFTLLVESTATLRWVAGGADLNLRGASLEIQSGGQINRNGQGGARLDIVAGSFLDIIVNDNSVGLDVEDIRINSSNMDVTFSGSGRVYINDDFVINDQGNNVTNDITGSFVINDFLNFGGSSDVVVFTNNQPLSINDDLRFNNQECTFINNSTVTIVDDIVVGTNDQDNAVTNNVGAIISMDQIRLGNGDGFVFTNFGTVNQARQFVNNTIPVNNTFTNETNATWNYGGNNTFDSDVQLFTDFAGSTFNYNRVGAQTIIVPQDAYNHLILSGGGTKNLTTNLDIDGNFTLTGGTFVMNANIVTLAGNFLNSIAINDGTSTLTLDGSNQNITSGGQALFNLNIAGTGTKTLLDNLNIDGALTISSTLDVSGSNFDINLAGDFTNDGIFVGQAGEVILDGGADQSITGTTSTTVFEDLTFNKAGGQTLIENTAQINGTLAIPQAITVDADGSGGSGIILFNSVSGSDARMDQIATGTTITGDLTVRKYYPNADGGRNWRYIGAPVSSTTVADLKNFLPVTGIFNDPSTQAEWPGIPGILSTGISMYHCDETIGGDLDQGWTAFPASGVNSSAATLDAGVGFAVFYRDPNPLTIDFTGAWNGTDVGVNVTYTNFGLPNDDGWSVIANPFVSAIDWDLVTLPAGVNDEIHFRDNANSLGQGEGTLFSYVSGVSTPPGYDGQIPIGQAFWVRATANSTITFQQDDKISNPTIQFIKAEPVPDLLRFRLSNSEKKHEAAIRFHIDATDDFDKMYDASLREGNFSISSPVESGFSIINTFNSDFCQKVIPLTIMVPESGNHSVEFYNLSSFSNSMDIYLHDHKADTVLEISENFTFSFSVDSTEIAANLDRFSVEFFRTMPDELNLIFEETVCDGEQRIIIGLTSESEDYKLKMNGETISSGSGSELFYDSNHLLEGLNELELVASNNVCGLTSSTLLAITKQSIPSVPVAEDIEICEPGSNVELVAIGGTNYRWYESQSSSDILEEGGSGILNIGSLDGDRSFWVSAVNNSGCESERVEVKAMVLELEPANISLTEENLLQSSEADGNQWFLDGELIVGATNQFLSPETNGNYTVQTTINNCSIESLPFGYFVTSIENNRLQDFEISIFPNPVTAEINFALGSGFELNETSQARIISIDGRVMNYINLSLGKFGYSESVENLETGIYILEVPNASGAAYHTRFIKK